MALLGSWDFPGRHAAHGERGEILKVACCCGIYLQIFRSVSGSPYCHWQAMPAVARGSVGAVLSPIFVFPQLTCGGGTVLGMCPHDTVAVFGSRGCRDVRMCGHCVVRSSFCLLRSCSRRVSTTRTPYLDCTRVDVDTEIATSNGTRFCGRCFKVYACWGRGEGHGGQASTNWRSG